MWKKVGVLWGKGGVTPKSKLRRMARSLKMSVNLNQDSIKIYGVIYIYFLNIYPLCFKTTLSTRKKHKFSIKKISPTTLCVFSYDSK